LPRSADTARLSPISHGFIAAADATLARLMCGVLWHVFCANSCHLVAASCWLLQGLLLPHISNWHPATPVGGVGLHAEGIRKANPRSRPCAEIVARSPLLRATDALGEFIR